MHTPNPANRIPTSLSTDRKLFGRYSLADLAVAAFPGVVVALGFQLGIPPAATVRGVRLHSLALPLSAVAICTGAVFVHLTPQYTSSLDWLSQYVRHTLATTQQRHDDATDTTMVERIHPTMDMIERTDGALVGLVSVAPPRMALATDAEWERKARAFQEFLNTTVEFPIQLYSTTREFPVEDHVAHHQARLTDPDVEATPTLATLIEEYITWHADRCARHPMTIRDHYVVVPVTPGETHFDRDDLIGRLADLPLLGLFVHALAAPPRAVERGEMAATLEDRLRRVTAGLREIDDCEAHRVPAGEATRVLAAFWTDDEPDDHLSGRLRSRSLVAPEDPRA